MLIKELEMHILDLTEKKEMIIKLKEAEICTQGFRIGLNGKTVRGVPHKNQDDCLRFCYIDTCDSL